MARADIKVVDVQNQERFTEVSVLNSSKVHLAQFVNWDVLIQHYDATGSCHIRQLSYTENPNYGNNQWSVAKIFSDKSMRQHEVFEPGPSEVALLRLKLISPGSDITKLVVLSNASGMVASARFQG